MCWQEAKRKCDEKAERVEKKLMLGSESDATVMVRGKWVWVRDSLPDEHEKETARDGEKKERVYYLLFSLELFAKQLLLRAVQLPL